MILVTTDTGSKLVVHCTNAQDREAIDLTGGGVLLRWKAGGTVEERPMTITNAKAGTCEYTFAGDELTAPRMRFEVEITDAEGAVVSSCELLNVQVREKLA